MMLFRVSEVEAFRQWRDDEDADLDLLLSRLRGESATSEAMAAGTAFHKALELSHVGFHGVQIMGNGYTFNFPNDMTLELPEIREVRSSKTWGTGDGEITITGQVDAIEGRMVADHKTTGRFDPERYMSGYQWKYYLSIFGADHFRWNVFEIAATDDPVVWDVHSFHRLEQYRYPGMEADCERLALDLAEFARQYMPERIKPVKLAA